MDSSDHTLTSPLSAAARADVALLCLTIVWHPDTSRIGEQCLASGASVQLSRYLPLFQRPGQAQSALGYGGISRECLLIERDAQDTLTIYPPTSRMAVELNGSEVREVAHLTADQVRAGAILGLGRAVMLCIHWMGCLPKNNPLPGLLGVGEAAIRVRDLVRQVAATDDPVLLLGETGTGKEVAARAIHACSTRAARPMVTVNMAALNESLAVADLFGAGRGAYTGAQSARNGLFAEASHATLFLDEIGNAPSAVQPMLLRVLETGDYRPLGTATDLRSSARLIAATDQDLYGGTFNQALLRRLEGFVIHLPPLRERREDIGVLLLHLLRGLPPGVAFPPELASGFANYDWPGNVRQLRHLAKRCMLLLQAGEHPDFESLLEVRPTRDLPGVPPRAPALATMPRRKKLAEISDADVLSALDGNDWYVQAAALQLGISRPSMYKLINDHPQIRQAAQIPASDIVDALSRSGGDTEACAALLKTPTEALRRHLRGLNLAAEDRRSE